MICKMRVAGLPVIPPPLSLSIYPLHPPSQRRPAYSTDSPPAQSTRSPTSGWNHPHKQQQRQRQRRRCSSLAVVAVVVVGNRRRRRRPRRGRGWMWRGGRGLLLLGVLRVAAVVVVERGWWCGQLAVHISLFEVCIHTCCCAWAEDCRRCWCRIWSCSCVSASSCSCSKCSCGMFVYMCIYAYIYMCVWVYVRMYECVGVRSVIGRVGVNWRKAVWFGCLFVGGRW